MPRSETVCTSVLLARAVHVQRVEVRRGARVELGSASSQIQHGDLRALEWNLDVRNAIWSEDGPGAEGSSPRDVDPGTTRCTPQLTSEEEQKRSRPARVMGLLERARSVRKRALREAQRHLCCCGCCCARDLRVRSDAQDADADPVLGGAAVPVEADRKHGPIGAIRRKLRALFGPRKRKDGRETSKPWRILATYRHARKAVGGKIGALRQMGKSLGEKILASGIIPARFRRMRLRRRGAGENEDGKQRAHDLCLAHEMKDLQCVVNQAVRAGMMSAQYFMEKTIRERMEELRRLREEEERRRAWEEACHAARLKYSAQYARELWDYLHEWSLSEGVKSVIAYRKYLEYLRDRERRAVAAFGRFAHRLETRRRGAVLSRVAIFRITLGRVFEEHSRRQDAARDIQCAFRVLMARRDFLMAYIEQEARMLEHEKAQVWRKWAARLARAIQSIAHVETEAHRQARRRVWARTEFSRALAKEHFFTYGHPPARDPPAVTAFDKPCDGHVALKLPDTQATKIVAPIGDDSPEARRLNWIGVPVGISRRFTDEEEAMLHEHKRAAAQSGSNNAKGAIRAQRRRESRRQDRFSLVYMPMPAHLLGVSLEDARSRAKAQEDLEALKAAALQPNQDIDPAPGPATDWYAQEKALLWQGVSLVEDEILSV